MANLSPQLTDVLDARITETIATTSGSSIEKNEEKRQVTDVNVAPMGVLQEDERMYARLWEGSTTLENVRETEEVVVNITRDPVVYVEGAVGDASRFADEENVRLRDVDAWFVCDATEVPSDSDHDEVTRWRLEERDGDVVKERVPTFSRGFASVVEATVHATRLEFKPELQSLYEHHLEVAEKCGGEREREAMSLLRGYVDD